MLPLSHFLRLQIYHSEKVTLLGLHGVFGVPTTSWAHWYVLTSAAPVHVADWLKNLLSPDVVKEACAEIRDGRRFSLK